ncbi:LysR family transcriptional regulator [Micromonospora sp. NPDC006766]|uniref:LysR family transcriptional regulator n=1 Tax=Micromonospora sp. NPDC006766 TaxID=3154778 RepID=UPI0033CF73BC
MTSSNVAPCAASRPPISAKMRSDWARTSPGSTIAPSSSTSITAAARSLRYTQSAVSRQVAGLEAEVGAPLFDRLPRGVALTEEGRCLLGHVEAVLDRLDSARRDLAALRELTAGRLRVGAFPTAVAALVPRALATFRSAHPQVALQLVEGLTPGLLDRLLAGDADVAVVSAAPDQPLDGERFDLCHLVDEVLLVAVPRTHRLAHRRTARPRPAPPAPRRRLGPAGLRRHGGRTQPTARGAAVPHRPAGGSGRDGLKQSTYLD